MSNSEWTAPEATDRDIVAVIDSWGQDFKRFAAGQFSEHGEENPDSPMAPLWRALCVLCSEAWHIRQGLEQALERSVRGGDAVQVSEHDDPLGLADAVQVSEDDDPPEVP
jgi:hypothetical protein